ncbi:MAG TPA: sarcosine oxidase subunit gamma family protein [Geminicoccaceae bacterium]
MAERRGALGGVRSGERIRIVELPGRTLVQVSAFHGRLGPAEDALEEALGLRPPGVVGQTSEDGDRRILCVGPGRWWMIGADPGHVQLDPALGAVVEQSHGRTVIEVRGTGVRDLLAKGTSIDLHPKSFPAGACAATALAQIAVVLEARADDRIEIHVPRSYARFLVEWLEDAALEFEGTASA